MCVWGEGDCLGRCFHKVPLNGSSCSGFIVLVFIEGDLTWVIRVLTFTRMMRVIRVERVIRVSRVVITDRQTCCTWLVSRAGA